MNILLAEDDPAAVRFLKQAIYEAGYQIEIAEDGVKALSMALSGDYVLLLLDVMLPGMDGFEICRRLRSQGISTHILLLTARDTLEDKIEGLDSGADDYIVKPFRVAELLARMRAMVRRVAAPPDILRVADLTLDPTSHTAIRGERTIPLSTTECALLEYLMRNKGRVLTRSMILEHVWQYDFEGNDNVLDVYIGYLRKKIDRDFSPPLIHTVRSVGFRLGVLSAR